MKLFLTRTGNSLAGTYSNLMPSLLAVYAASGEAHQITVWLISSGLTVSLCITQWERDHQPIEHPKQGLLALYSFVGTIAYLAISVVENVNINFWTVISIWTSQYVYGYISVFGSLISVNGLSKNYSLVQLARTVATTILGLSLMYKQDLTLQHFLHYWIVIHAVLLIGVTLYLRLPRAKSSRRIQRSGMYLISIDFLRGQLWVIFSPLFAPTISTSALYLIRQLLSPLAMLLAAKRSAAYDRYYISKGQHHPTPARRMYILISLIFCAPLIPAHLFELLNTTEVLAAFAWILIVLTQDYRGYLNRRIDVNIGESLRAMFTSSIPSLLLVGVVLFSTQLSILFLLYASLLSELLLIVVYRNQRHASSK